MAVASIVLDIALSSVWPSSRRKAAISSGASGLTTQRMNAPSEQRRYLPSGAPSLRA
jgi:hypothetical protein